MQERDRLAPPFHLDDLSYTCTAEKLLRARPRTLSAHTACGFLSGAFLQQTHAGRSGCLNGSCSLF